MTYGKRTTSFSGRTGRMSGIGDLRRSQRASTALISSSSLSRWESTGRRAPDLFGMSSVEEPVRVRRAGALRVRAPRAARARARRRRRRARPAGRRRPRGPSALRVPRSVRTRPRTSTEISSGFAPGISNVRRQRRPWSTTSTGGTSAGRSGGSRSPVLTKEADGDLALLHFRPPGARPRSALSSSTKSPRSSKRR